jgi:hypothetical protein
VATPSSGHRSSLPLPAATYRTATVGLVRSRRPCRRRSGREGRPSGRRRTRPGGHPGRIDATSPARAPQPADGRLDVVELGEPADLTDSW